MRHVRVRGARRLSRQASAAVRPAERQGSSRIARSRLAAVCAWSGDSAEVPESDGRDGSGAALLPGERLVQLPIVRRMASARSDPLHRGRRDLSPGFDCGAGGRRTKPMPRLC